MRRFPQKFLNSPSLREDGASDKVKILAITERALQLSFLLTCIPLLVVMVAKFPVSPVWMTRAGLWTLGYWAWVWIPAFICAKALFIRLLITKERTAARQLLKWYIGMNVVLIIETIIALATG